MFFSVGTISATDISADQELVALCPTLMLLASLGHSAARAPHFASTYFFSLSSLSSVYLSSALPLLLLFFPHIISSLLLP